MTLKTQREDVDTSLQSSGQQVDYLVLSDEERSKGFVRPVRKTYLHTGMRPNAETRDLNAEELALYADQKYVRYEEYPKDDSTASVGRFWTQAELDSGCGGSQTTMGLELAETYARNPRFYGSTFCCSCRTHFPVAEFKWLDGQTVGS